jgi:hypothetical protein
MAWTEVGIRDDGITVVMAVRTRGSRGIWNPALARVTIQCGFIGGVTVTTVTCRCAGIEVRNASAVGSVGQCGRQT